MRGGVDGPSPALRLRLTEKREAQGLRGDGQDVQWAMGDGSGCPGAG